MVGVKRHLSRAYHQAGRDVRSYVGRQKRAGKRTYSRLQSRAKKTYGKAVSSFKSGGRKLGRDISRLFK